LHTDSTYYQIIFTLKIFFSFHRKSGYWLSRWLNRAILYNKNCRKEKIYLRRSEKLMFLLTHIGLSVSLDIWKHSFKLPMYYVLPTPSYSIGYSYSELKTQVCTMQLSKYHVFFIKCFMLNRSLIYL